MGLVSNYILQRRWGWEQGFTVYDYEAAELLDKLMAGQESIKKDIIVEPMHVVTRQSTDILAVEDQEVAEAMRFIRQHSKRIIQVSDVVDSVGLSRRVLQQRFRRILGRSVYDEIKRCRLEQIALMLAETDLSISQVASAFGYAGIEKLSRYFQREKGMTPLAYRKQYGHKQLKLKSYIQFPKWLFILLEGL